MFEGLDMFGGHLLYGFPTYYYIRDDKQIVIP